MRTTQLMQKMRPLPALFFLAASACTAPMAQVNDAAGGTAEPGPQPVDLQAIPTPLTPIRIAQGQRSIPEPAPAAEAEPRYADAWERIRANLNLPRHTDQNSVTGRLRWYSRHQDYLDRVAERATPYLHYIIEQLEQRGLPIELALLPVVESAYQPFAYSPSRASGIWQFIPGTGRRYGLKQNWWYDGRRDIVAATRAALDYLEELYTEFDGDWLHALASYNTGEGNVARAIRRNRNAGRNTDFWSLRLPRETRGYVPSLLAMAEIVARPEKYGIRLQPVPDEPYFNRVQVNSQIDLAVAAELAGLNMDEIYTLNPGYNRWATDPRGPHDLLVPVAKADLFRQQLARLDVEERLDWKQHVIRRGESLSEIADRYHSSVDTIKQINNIRGNLIQSGHSLRIPSATMPPRHYSLSVDSRRYRGLKRMAGDGEKYLYTVRRGDTLWDIGRQYGVSIRNLSRWNGIATQRYLQPGQQLTLWLAQGGAAADDTSDSLAGNQVTATDTGVMNYTVQPGDSLWLISRRFGVTITQLVEWNNISKDKYLQPGQELILRDAPNLATGV